jgi:SAM-dependent methyltransferase
MTALDADLRPILEHVRDARQVDLAGVDGSWLAECVQRRMGAVGAADQVGYVDVLGAQPAEIGRLFDAILADRASLDWSYDVYPRIEDRFLAALDESLRPSGPELLYDLVGGLGLPRGAMVVDVGCGEGRHSVALAGRFGFDVLGIDPTRRHLELANEALADAAGRDPSLPGRVRFALGHVEALPVDDAAVDLVWFRDALEHVERLDVAFAEIRRALRDGGRALVYSMFTTDRPQPEETGWLWRTLGGAPGSDEPATVEAAMAGAGLRIDERIELGTEWGEWSEELAGTGSRRLLHTARMLRAPDRYVEEFGRAAYDIMLADCLWHVYRMLGKLSGRVYLLSR